MAKYVISEDKLIQIISERINESLQDEGLGTKIAQGLGNARQWVQNKVDNYKNAFNAGRNQQRYANRNYDPYQGMKGANNYRNFNGDEYGQYRYNVTADRNNTSRQSWDNEYGTQTQRRPSVDGERAENYRNGKNGVNGGIEPDTVPELSGKNTTNANPAQQPSRGRQPRQANSIADLQTRFNSPRGVRDVGVENAKLISLALGEYKKNHPEVNEDTIRRAVNESLKKFLNEIGDTERGQFNLGKLSARRMNQAMDAQKNDNEAAKGDYVKRSVNAYTKARDERSKQYKDGDPMKNYLASAYDDGENKENKKARK